MPNHFRAIGLAIESKEDYRALVKRVADEGEFIPTRRGGYVRWSPGDGVEMWAQINQQNQLVAANPHFAGQSHVDLGGVGLIGPDETNIALHGWVKSAEETDSTNLYPLVCALPAYYLRDTPLEPQQSVTAQITAFAHDLTCFADEASFDAAQGSGQRYAANFFIPSGLFISPEAREAAAQSGGEVMPKPHALFAGTVLDAQLLHNAETALDFWALSVETYGATLDVVADPDLVQGALAVGCIVKGSFYLSARLLDW